MLLKDVGVLGDFVVLVPGPVLGTDGHFIILYFIVHETVLRGVLNGGLDCSVQRLLEMAAIVAFGGQATVHGAVLSELAHCQGEH